MAEKSFEERIRTLDTWFDRSADTNKSWPRGTRELCERAYDAGRATVGVREAAPRRHQWQPIETAPLEEFAEQGRAFVGGFQHKTYGWLWGKCHVYGEDKHGISRPYVVMDGGGVPTHWLLLPELGAAPPQEPPPHAGLQRMAEQVEAIGNLSEALRRVGVKNPAAVLRVLDDLIGADGELARAAVANEYDLGAVAPPQEP